MDKNNQQQGGGTKNILPTGGEKSNTLPTAFEAGNYSLDDFSKFNQHPSGGVSDIKDDQTGRVVPFAAPKDADNPQNLNFAPWCTEYESKVPEEK